jgi:hypothetical protein
MATRVRPKPKYKPRARIGPLPGFALVALRWSITWAVVGFAVGILNVLGHSLPFVELESPSASAAASPFGIVALGLSAAAGGLGMGLLYACLWIWSADLREAYEKPGFAGTVRPYALCGAAAGLIAGFLVGGFTGALFFALLGAMTAIGLNWREIRTGLETSRSPQRPTPTPGQRRGA